MTAPRWAQPPIPDADQLSAIRQHIVRARDLQAQKEDLEARLTDTNVALQTLQHQTLPDLMDRIGIPSVTVAASGNLPTVKVTCGPYYKANIAADWDPARRNAALNWLDRNGHGDLIKTVVSVALNRTARADAVALAGSLTAAGYAADVTQAVAWNTLTAWLREQVEANATPPLDVIGGTVGRIATVKEQT